MPTSELAVALTIGVSLSLLFSEFSGVLPGGLVVPGYLAICWNQPMLLLMVVGISLLTSLLVSKLLGRFIILYGRRKFAAMLLIGIALTLACDSLFPLTPFAATQLRGVGIVVPGLLANCIHRQGLLPTIASTLLLMALTAICLGLYTRFF